MWGLYERLTEAISPGIHVIDAIYALIVGLQ